MVTRETSISAGLSSLGVLASVEDPEECVRRLGHFAELLAEEAIPRGLMGPGEEPRIVVRHILDSGALATLIADEGTLVDVGSGAGLPGVVLACLLGTADVVLVEPRGRRAAFLRRVAQELGLAVRVVQSPAEEAARSALRESARTVVARGVGPPAVALELTLPLVMVGGVAVLPIGDPGAERPGSADVVSPSAVGSGAAADGAHRAPERAEEPDGRSERRRSRGSPLGEQPARAVGARPAIGAGEGRSGAPRWAGVAGELGGEAPRLARFEVPGGSLARWVMLVRRIHPTPERYPRRPGVPRRRPLGGV